MKVEIEVVATWNERTTLGTISALRRYAGLGEGPSSVSGLTFRLPVSLAGETVPGPEDFRLGYATSRQIMEVRREINFDVGLGLSEFRLYVLVDGERVAS